MKPKRVLEVLWKRVGQSYEPWVYARYLLGSTFSFLVTVGFLLCAATLMFAPSSDSLSDVAESPPHMMSRLKMPRGLVEQLVYGDDGRRLLASLAYGSRLVGGWDLALGQPLELAPIDYQRGTVFVTLSPGGDVVAISDGRQSLELWSVWSGEVVCRLEVGESRIGGPAFSPDGQVVGVADEEGVVRLFETETGRERARWRTNLGWVLCNEFSPDGRTFCLGGRGGKVERWEVDTGRLWAELKGQTGNVISLAHSPDGQLIATGNDQGEIEIWDAVSNRGRLRTGIMGRSPVLCLAYSPDGSLLASGHADCAVRLWDARSGVRARDLVGHRQPVHALAFSPDGRTLATGDGESVVVVWDVAKPVD